jgi:hypothetical protein
VGQINLYVNTAQESIIGPRPNNIKYDIKSLYGQEKSKTNIIKLMIRGKSIYTKKFKDENFQVVKTL